MTRTITFAAAGLFAVLAAGSASAQTAPAADPHAGHIMPSTAPQIAPQTAAPADPHAGHTMPAGSHAGHDMSAMSSMSVPAPTGTALRASLPAAGAMLNASPSGISITLPHAMKVDSVVLTNAAGQRIPLSATLSDAEVETLTMPVPTLTAGTYRVAWTASMGANHTMTGTFAFMVH
jgi:methionine-rich copper-binding protein CopC